MNKRDNTKFQYRPINEYEKIDGYGCLLDRIDSIQSNLEEDEQISLFHIKVNVEDLEPLFFEICDKLLHYCGKAQKEQKKK